jgi:hypothetical protein
MIGRSKGLSNKNPKYMLGKSKCIKNSNYKIKKGRGLFGRGPADEYI